MTEKLQVGDIMFTTIGGATGALVNLGQAIIRDGCRLSHVGIMVGENEVLEAMPTNSRIRTLTAEDKKNCLFLRIPLTDEQRSEVFRKAWLFTGRKYSFVSYLALGLIHWGLKPALLERYIAKSNRLICSQLVDRSLSEAGYKVFDDGRWYGDVSPGDLYYALTMVDGARFLHS